MLSQLNTHIHGQGIGMTKIKQQQTHNNYDFEGLLIEIIASSDCVLASFIEYLGSKTHACTYTFSVLLAQPLGGGISRKQSTVRNVF